METLAAGVWRSIERARPDAVLIAHGGANRALVWWFPLTIARLVRLIVRRQVEVVIAGDALTYAVITPVLRLARIHHAAMIMGLDVTYQNRAYRAVVHSLLRRASKVIAISAATAERAREFGVPASRVTVLRLGVPTEDVSLDDRRRARTAVQAKLGLANDSVVLLTLGRLVRRKGVRWFVASVLPKLPDTTHYAVAGNGPEAEAIRDAAASAGVADRVHLMGRVEDSDRENLLRGADLFVQPNIAVPGDMEGFGLVTIEAAMRGTPVVAADLEGIKDAVVNGRTGVLLTPEDAGEWASKVTELLGDLTRLATLGAEYRAEAESLYGEQTMGRALCDVLGLSPTAVSPATPAG
jgi:phosphatidylinositol alpha-1,6-mannosyltransferase